jgi:hypothetical protein
MAEESKTAIATLNRNMQRIAAAANAMSPHSSAFRGHSRTPATNPASSSKKETYKQRQTRIRKQKANTRAARANSRNRVQGIRYTRSVTRKTIKK